MVYEATEFPFSITKKVSDPTFTWIPNVEMDQACEVNTLNQLVTVNGQTLTYNNNGCLSSDGNTDYIYSPDNKLISATNAVGTVELKYDPLGRLIQKTKNGATLHYLYAGLQRIEEYESGSLKRRYVYGEGLDECLFSVEVPSGAVTYIHTDERGSAILTTDASGNPLQKNVYTPWGKLVSGSLASHSIGFTSQFFDSDLDLYYYKSRFYNPSLGRFMQPDSARLREGPNFYAYCGNDPVSNRDSSGMGFDGIPDPPIEIIVANPYDPFPNLTALGANPGNGVGSAGNGGNSQNGSGGAGSNTAAAAAEAARQAAALRLAKLRAYWANKKKEGIAMAQSEIDAFILEVLQDLIPELRLEAEIAGTIAKGWSALARAISKVNKSHLSGESGVEKLMKLFPGGLREYEITTANGLRRIDLFHPLVELEQFAKGFAREAKSGRQSLSKVLEEVLKDVDLIHMGYDVEWHFFVSPVTGKKGPGASLKFLLQLGGIPYFIHKQ